ncbi:MAG: YraN family protein [Eubacteriales bacterium]|nr:YraN family protein [Eubacteriales bacterium]
MNKRTIGSKYEDIAARFLEYCGYDIICKNFRCRDGEIDIIARDGDILVFAEVKYRSTAAYGFPAEAVNAKKQQKIRAVARQYLSGTDAGGSRKVSSGSSSSSGDTVNTCSRRKSYKGIRFDVVEILGDKIRVLKDCF